MTLEECYKELGGDLEGTVLRLRKEELVHKFALRFLEDPSFDALCASLEMGDYTAAFRAAHTLKGVCQNLGFDRLYKSSSELTEALRGNAREPDKALVKKVVEDYSKTRAALEGLKNSPKHQ